MAMRERMMVYSPQDVYLFDIPSSQIYDGSIREQINGEHSITIVTTFQLEKEQRILWRDGMGKWREYVITGYKASHNNGDKTIGTYNGVWSLQHDLQVTQVSRMPGIETPVTAGEALGAALSGTSRWSVGTVTISTLGGISMYDMQTWEAMKLLLETWGGEIDARITVGSKGVVSRYVDYAVQIGNGNARRRFEYARDMSSIERVVEEGVVACRIVPRGKGEEVGSGYGRKIKIGEINGGIDWLQNNDSAAIYRLPDGNGGYEYPTVFADNGDIEDRYELKAWGQSVLNQYTTPKVTYKGDVLQLHAAGMDVHGVALGDSVICSDRKFAGNGLTIEGRVVEQVINLKDKRRNKVTIGYVKTPITVTIARNNSSMSNTLSALRQQADKTTAMVLHEILDIINEQINATGGYAYLVPGIGAVTYDTEVEDPSEGDEASQVTEMRGGTLRFANSRTATGDWDYTNVITADGYLALAATIARLTTGFIGNANGGNYWNLDTGELRMAAASTKVGTQTLAQYIGDNLGLTQQEVFNLLTNNGALQGLYMSNNNLYVNASYIKTGNLLASLITSGKIQSSNGKVYFDLTNNELVCDKMVSTGNNSTIVTIGSSSVTTGGTSTSYSGLLVRNGASNTQGLVLQVSSSSSDAPLITSTNKKIRVECRVEQGGNMPGGVAGMIVTSSGYTVIHGGTTKMSDSEALNSTTNNDSGRIIIHPSYQGYSSTYTTDGLVEVFDDFRVRGRATIYELIVTGPKNRAVETEHYGERLLYSYETACPMFGDVGSGEVGDDGLCYVEIDEVLSETVRCDFSYQVFLQKCGRGELWVAEKHPTYFVVAGTAGIRFDWEIKARQSGFETSRLEDLELRQAIEDNAEAFVEFTETLYENDIDQQTAMLENIYDLEVTRETTI